MDFGLVGLEYFFGAEDGISSSQVENKQRSHGSGFDEQQRSGSAEEAWRSSKMAKADDFSASKIMSLHQGVAQLRSNSIISSDNRQQEHMLSFSSPIVSQVPLQRNTQSSSFSYYQRMPSSDAYNRNTVYGSGSVNPNMHGPFAVVRGPFTPSQWIELEHQALIYKYITSNVPVPSHLLIPIKKALYPYGLSSGSSLPPNSIGWGSFHLGLSGNTDPEPGRCRRTDGKKWRCSRDAVPEQKYCERHINRGRHRSRKPVEGQTGQAVTGNTNSKVAPMTSSVSTSVISSGGASNSLTITPHQFKSLQASVGANPSSDAIVNRTKDSQGLSFMSCSTIGQKSNDTTANVSKLKSLLEEESSRSQFGLVATDSLVNPSQKSTYLSTNFLDFSVQETQVEHQLRQFMDDWPKDQCDSITTWHDEMKLDSTQLSMFTPMVSSDFSSLASSPIQDKLAISPLRLFHEFKPMQMNKGGVNYDFSVAKQKEVNWVPISWETSMGGPLGEVLTNTPSHAIACKSTYSLNLSKEGCDGSPQIGSSPTGVLQKSALSNSLSNSSSASSPRPDNRRNPDGASLYDDVLGSTLASFSTPSL